MTARGAPIGVFDSGVGGLTVLRALRAVLPTERFIYLGDTARLPYGTKSGDTVVRYSLQCAGALVERGIGRLVVACNTASAYALDSLRSRYPRIPVTGVIEAGAAAAVAATRTRHIAVIGTEGTIAGGAYQAAIARLGAGVRVTAVACPLFVALAEEGLTEGEIAQSVARRYLEPIFSRIDAGAAPDTLVLGCTHFPALARAIRLVVPHEVSIVDSAATVAAAVARELTLPEALLVSPEAMRPSPRDRGDNLAAPGNPVERGDVAAHGDDPSSRECVAPGAGAVRWLATDGAARFARVSGTFLGAPLPVEDIEIIDL